MPHKFGRQAHRTAILVNELDMALNHLGTFFDTHALSGESAVALDIARCWVTVRGGTDHLVEDRHHRQPGCIGVRHVDPWARIVALVRNPGVNIRDHATSFRCGCAGPWPKGGEEEALLPSTEPQIFPSLPFLR